MGKIKTKKNCNLGRKCNNTVVQIMGLRQENLVSENGSPITNVGPENLLTYSELLFSYL